MIKTDVVLNNLGFNGGGNGTNLIPDMCLEPVFWRDIHLNLPNKKEPETEKDEAVRHVLILQSRPFWIRVCFDKAFPKALDPVGPDH